MNKRRNDRDCFASAYAKATADGLATTLGERSKKIELIKAVNPQLEDLSEGWYFEERR